MNITVVGLGLIGGSMALDLKSQINVNVYGVDASEENCKLALDLNLIDKIISLPEAYEVSDVIILAVPVDVLEKLLPEVMANIDSNVTIIDVGSTKSKICRAVRNISNRENYVASHPLAGTEFSGPNAAISGLFRNAKNIVCERDLSGKAHLEKALRVFKSLGMNSFFLSPDEHDRHLAYVSHLSHVTSFSLGLTVLEIEKDEQQIFNLASTGFRSTSRLAKSNPQTWKAIFTKNQEYLVESLERYIGTLVTFKEAIEKNDENQLIDLMQKANDIKRILDKKN